MLVIKFYQECESFTSKFSMKVVFKHTKTAASEITKKQPVILSTVEGSRTPSYSMVIFQTFHAYYFCLQSSLSQSLSVLIFSGLK